MKRVLAIHDLSCFGKCSLTVALPILSACGVETVCLPTAILSTHTGGFTGFTYRDLTEDLPEIADHWSSLGLRFDGIYTGFLGSFDQIDIVKEIFERFPCSCKVVDPVMGDNGKLYTIFDKKFAGKMRELCALADVIVPNMTEACLLLDEEYLEPPYRKSTVEEVLKKLCGLGCRRAVLTGVAYDDAHLGAACYDGETGAFSYYLNERIPGAYHGTGDVFGSALTGALLRGKTLEESIRVAVEFTLDSIRRTAKAGTPSREGVRFEEAIPGLLRLLK